MHRQIMVCPNKIGGFRYLIFRKRNKRNNGSALWVCKKALGQPTTRQEGLDIMREPCVSNDIQHFRKAGHACDQFVIDTRCNKIPENLHRWRCGPIRMRLDAQGRSKP